MRDKRRYRFHYIDFQNRLISRWDNVPHHREIKTFPSHKHTIQGVEESKAINLIEVLEEIELLIKV